MAELDEETKMWMPTLIGEGTAFSLPVYFGTLDACVAFLSIIPAGQTQ